MHDRRQELFAVGAGLAIGGFYVAVIVSIVDALIRAFH
jgi:hypothetical protein